MDDLAETIAVLVELVGDYAYELMRSRACEQQVLDILDEPLPSRDREGAVAL